MARYARGDLRGLGMRSGEILTGRCGSGFRRNQRGLRGFQQLVGAGWIYGLVPVCFKCFKFFDRMKMILKVHCQESEMSEHIHMRYVENVPVFYFVDVCLPVCSEMNMGLNGICFRKRVKCGKSALLTHFKCMIVSPG